MDITRTKPRIGVGKDNLQFSINDSTPAEDGHPIIRVKVYENDFPYSACIRLEDLHQLVQIIAQLDQSYGTGEMEMY